MSTRNTVGMSLDLLAAAQRGEPRAQAEVFAIHKHHVARLVQRMTGDAGVVDDLVQEVFVAAFSALHRFKAEAQLKTWLSRITVNKVRNWWDAKRRRENRERNGIGPATEDWSADDALEAAERYEQLYAALGRLPNDLREAFTLRAIQGLSLRDAAAVLGAPISTVSHRTRQAERRICAAMGLETEVGK